MFRHNTIHYFQNHDSLVSKISIMINSHTKQHNLPKYNQPLLIIDMQHNMTIQQESNYRK